MATALQLLMVCFCSTADLLHLFSCANCRFVQRIWSGCPPHCLLQQRQLPRCGTPIILELWIEIWKVVQVYVPTWLGQLTSLRVEIQFKSKSGNFQIPVLPFNQIGNDRLLEVESSFCSNCNRIFPLLRLNSNDLILLRYQNVFLPLLSMFIFSIDMMPKLRSFRRRL